MLKIIAQILPLSLVNFFTKGHYRTKLAKKHIALSYIYQGLDIVLGFVLISLVLKYLDKESYGVWIILYSLTLYFNFMDVGLSNGLRNKITEAKAKGEIEKIRHYVSTTYVTIGIISFVFFTIFILINPYLNWTKILNTDKLLNNELSILAMFVFGSFASIFFLKTLTTILTANQKPSILRLQTLLTKFMKLMMILILLHSTKGSLLILGITFSIIPVVVLIFLSVYFFSKEYKEFRPSLKYSGFIYLKDLLPLGVKFFVIGIAGVILFTTDNMIITQLYGPEQVTSYQLAHKYFGISIMLFMIIVQPIWSAITDAYNKNDFKWIKKITAKMQTIWLYFTLGTFVMLCISPFFFKIWVGNKVTIPFMLSISWAVFVVTQSYNAIYTHCINGIGKVKIQMIVNIISAILNIPLSIILAKYAGMGISGVITATTISMIINVIFMKIQFTKIINGNAVGVWND